MMTTWSAIPKQDRVSDEPTRAATRSGGELPAFQVAADVRETKDAYTFQLDLPGVRLQDVEVTLDGHVLSIRGERRFERGPQERVTCGRRHGPFAVSYTLPRTIDGENLTADLADGVLTVRVPKQPEAQPRKIPISAAT